MRGLLCGLALAMAIACAGPARAQVSPGPVDAALTRQETDAVLEALAGAADDGIVAADAADLRAALAASGGGGSGDAMLLAAVLRYASDQHGGRVDPPTIDEHWALRPEPFDVTASFAAARSAHALAPWLAALAPPFDGYKRLRAASARYRAIVAAGGWAPVADKLWRLGDADPGVAALRERLRLEGYAAAETPEAAVFDEGLGAAVSAFQQTHALAATGGLDKGTIAALNVSAAQRLAQIHANLERWRWLPRALPASRIEINVAAATLTMFVAGAPVTTRRVIVGRKRLATPLFATQIEGVIFNPAWNVPTSIAVSEILPAARRDPSYLARNDFTRVDGRLVQAPGPKNALGQLKFDMPNVYGVYLHDTPAKTLFTREDRRLSHGCMRVEEPRDLAALLLQDSGWTRASIDEAIATGVTQRAALAAPFPVYVAYLTAIVDDAGVLAFLPDAYGWDEKLEGALAAPATTTPTQAAHAGVPGSPGALTARAAPAYCAPPHGR
jgi:murein L,D-transpeptidase YcbB/YkuD